MLVLGVVNALDISTSLIRSPADAMVPMPQRSPWEWLVQLAALGLLLPWLLRRGPRIYRAYQALAIPSFARGVLALFALIELGHIALRFERFPWSPVAMFSSAVPRASGDTISRVGYVIVRRDGLEHVSMLREGSPAFARHGLGFDYKAGWAMHLYGPTHSTARDVLVARVREEGLPEPIRTRVAYSRATGRLLTSLRPGPPR